MIRVCEGGEAGGGRQSCRHAATHIEMCMRVWKRYADLILVGFSKSHCML